MKRLFVYGAFSMAVIALALASVGIFDSMKHMMQNNDYSAYIAVLELYGSMSLLAYTSAFVVGGCRMSCGDGNSWYEGMLLAFHCLIIFSFHIMNFGFVPRVLFFHANVLYALAWLLYMHNNIKKHEKNIPALHV